MGVMSVRRLFLAAVVSLCSLIGCLSLSASVALAVTPPVVEETGVLDVAGTSATLQARINPEGSETTYRFEYGTSEAYGTSIPVPDGLVGSGSEGVAVGAHPQDLLPSTTYHYRVVALVASRSETVPDSDGTFTTQPAGSEFALPDGRQWELVSPPNKHGAEIGSLATHGPIQASEDGSGITYQTNVPTEPEPQGYVEHSQVLSSRGVQGWSSRDIAPPHTSPTFSGGTDLTEYQFFSRDLSSGLLFLRGQEAPSLLSGQASENTPYVRREALCDAPGSASECYLPVLTGKEGFADVPTGIKFGAASRGEFPVSFQGASPDLRHVLVQSNVALTATPIPRVQIYEWSSGVPAAEALRLVSVLPVSEGGGPAAGGASLGGFFDSGWSGANHAVSDDGSRVFWAMDMPNGGHSLYMRATVKGETVRLDAQQPGVTSGGEPTARFQIASGDGSKVFFTSEDKEHRLTAQSGTQGNDLYECEIVEEAGKFKCDLTDLTPEVGGNSAEVQYLVLGASHDGSYVYFVANSMLAQGATQGACSNRNTEESASAACNLYEYHDGEITFITTLGEDDEHDWNQASNGIGSLTARVSPDGRFVTFMSDRSITGYDNRDANSGKPDMEVYLYDSMSRRLVCASCNLTGSRPVGAGAKEFTNSGKEPRPNIVAVLKDDYGPERWIAANLPGGNWLGSYGEALYQPRALSDGGRVFFNSLDALVPQDVNGQEDVYEFEPQGTGGCTASSVTFNQESGGCVGLVSAGTSPEESGFLDASEGDGDVFFLTASRLTSQDYDTSLDIYDAHECSVSVPCVAQPVPAPVCGSGDSCKAAPSLQPSVFGAPASATFAGAGNVVGSSSTPTVKPRSSTRAQRLARALRACRKKPKRKRTSCEKQARRRYGARTARTAAGPMRKAQG
jgi:WD40-like Beta Propeller Repeat